MIYRRTFPYEVENIIDLQHMTDTSNNAWKSR
jgi:hypothetical protein